MIPRFSVIAAVLKLITVGEFRVLPAFCQKSLIFVIFYAILRHLNVHLCVFSLTMMKRGEPVGANSSVEVREPPVVCRPSFNLFTYFLLALRTQTKISCPVFLILSKFFQFAMESDTTMFLLQDPSKLTPERVFKVVFVGDSGVGKSSFIHRFCNDAFKEAFSATIG